MSPSVIAVDLGATSGRVVLTSFEDGRLALTEVHRFPTAATRTDAGLQLDVDALYAHIQDGIAGAMKLAGGEVAAVGIDCWAVDYGLLGDHGPLGRPFNYRDERTAVGKAEVERLIDAAELYSRVGIQDNAINTVNQLVEDRLAGRLDDARLFLLLPDLIGHRLTGRAVAERTNASTTSLLDPVDGDWDWELIDRLGLPRHIFPELIEPGTVVGTIIDGPAAGIELVAVGSHDTASAVVGAPLTGPDDVFISSGTWSLIGMELDAPILTEASRRANLTNEAGVDGTVRYLKNVMGMWLLSEAGRAWAEAGREVSIPSLVVEAEGVENALRFDATDPTLLHPGDMPARLTALVGGDARMDDPAFLARTVLESLADAYAATVAELARITGRRPERIVIVGGGANNALLSQLTADRTGLPVTAGPVEETAIGNSLIQARATGLVSGTLTDLRRIVMTSSETTSYSPDPRAVLAALSNEFGADPAFVRAGGGNSSVKLDGVLWIKPSGVSMATLAADDLVPLDLDLLNGSLDAPDPDPALGDPVNHIAGLARRDDGPRRPSVEILFHALIPDTYVVHTHPLLINAVTCNTVGRELTRDLFGDEVLWIPHHGGGVAVPDGRPADPGPDRLRRLLPRGAPPWRAGGRCRGGVSPRPRQRPGDRRRPRPRSGRVRRLGVLRQDGARGVRGRADGRRGGDPARLRPGPRRAGTLVHRDVGGGGLPQAGRQELKRETGAGQVTGPRCRLLRQSTASASVGVALAALRPGRIDASTAASRQTSTRPTV